MTKYDLLSPKQKDFFDLYVNLRALNPIREKLGWMDKEVRRVYSSKRVQEALVEHNENIKEASAYNEAVIIDKMWLEYHDPNTPKNVKVNILVMLGKHIGMWANTLQHKNTTKESNVTYNIINYANVKEEIEKNIEEVEKVKDQPEFEVPDGVNVTDYSGNA